MAATGKILSLSAIFGAAVFVSEVIVNAWMAFDPTGMSWAAKIAQAMGFTKGMAASTGLVAAPAGVAGAVPYFP